MLRILPSIQRSAFLADSMPVSTKSESGCLTPPAGLNSIKHLTYTKISISATEEAAAWWKVSLHGNAEPLNQKLPTYCLVGRRTEISFEKSFRILPQPTAAFPRSGASRPSPSGLGKTVIFVDYGQVSFEGRRWRRKRQGNNANGEVQFWHNRNCTPINPESTPCSTSISAIRQGESSRRSYSPIGPTQDYNQKSLKICSRLQTSRASSTSSVLHLDCSDPSLCKTSIVTMSSFFLVLFSYLFLNIFFHHPATWK